MLVHVLRSVRTLTTVAADATGKVPRPSDGSYFRTSSSPEQSMKKAKRIEAIFGRTDASVEFPARLLRKRERNVGAPLRSEAENCCARSRRLLRGGELYGQGCLLPVDEDGLHRREPEENRKTRAANDSAANFPRSLRGGVVKDDEDTFKGLFNSSPDLRCLRHSPLRVTSTEIRGEMGHRRRLPKFALRNASLMRRGPMNHNRLDAVQLEIALSNCLNK